MRIEYVHASRFGNGAMVAREFAEQMTAHGSVVEVHHIREVKPERLPAAELYVFSSPGRFGKPLRAEMRRFLAKVQLPAGTRFAIFTTEMQPKPDKKTGRMPTEEELARWQRVRPVMTEILEGQGLVKVTEGVSYVTGLRGPLEDGWRRKVETFASTLQTAATN